MPSSCKVTVCTSQDAFPLVPFVVNTSTRATGWVLDGDEQPSEIYAPLTIVSRRRLSRCRVRMRHIKCPAETGSERRLLLGARAATVVGLIGVLWIRALAAGPAQAWPELGLLVHEGHQRLPERRRRWRLRNQVRHGARRDTRRRRCSCRPNLVAEALLGHVEHGP